jgi:hypothetical protein
VFLFLFLYAFASLVMLEVVEVILHPLFFGHSAGDSSMRRYGIGWECFSVVVIVAYVVWLRRYPRSWLLAPILGVLAYLPGVIACYIAL